MSWGHGSTISLAIAARDRVPRPSFQIVVAAPFCFWRASWWFPGRVHVRHWAASLARVLPIPMADCCNHCWEVKHNARAPSSQCVKLTWARQPPRTLGRCRNPTMQTATVVRRLLLLPTLACCLTCSTIEAPLRGAPRVATTAGTGRVRRGLPRRAKFAATTFVRANGTMSASTRGCCPSPTSPLHRIHQCKMSASCREGRCRRWVR